MTNTQTTTNASAATTEHPGSMVKYQYHKRWMRFGEVLEIKGDRARVQWNEEHYSGTGKIINPLRVRTWVAIKKLMPA